MAERHTSIVSGLPFIDWSSGSIVSRPGTIVSPLPFGVCELPSIPEGNPDEGWCTASFPAQVGSIVWPHTHDVSSRLWIDSRVGTIPGGLGTIPRRPGSIAIRETFIPTRETIVPERETIVPGQNTFVDRRLTSAPGRELLVATHPGSHVCDQTPLARRVASDPTGQGCEGWAPGIGRHGCGDRSRAPIPRSQAHGDRTWARGDRRSCRVLLPKALILRSFAASRPPFRPDQGDSPRGQRGATPIHLGQATHQPGNTRNTPGGEAAKTQRRQGWLRIIS